MGYRILIVLMFAQTFLLAQTLEFSYTNQVCLTESVMIENTSGSDYRNFQWDFCEGDLFEPVQSYSSYLFGEIDQAAGIKIVAADGSYFGFVVDRSSNSLFRFDFGKSLDNKPRIHKVNLPSGLALSSPQGVSLIKASNNWFCFIASTGNSKLFRLDFGTSLLNDPFAMEINFLNHLNAPVEIEIAKDGTDYFLLALNFGSNSVVSANLGSVVTNHDPLSFQVTPIAGSSNPYGLSIQKYEDGNWRGIVGSYSNGSFHSLEFPVGLNGPAMVNDITSNLPVISNPVKLALVNWGKENLLLVMAYGGSIHRIQFKRNTLFSAVESSDILNGSYGPTLPLSVFYEKGNWKAFTLPITSRTLYIINFNKSCSQVNIPYYEGDNPSMINFNSSSISDITLRGESGGVGESISKELVVRSELAPAVSFIYEGVCLLSSINFASESNQLIQQYQWSFDDSQTSSLSNPSHQYSNAGDYTVQLMVQAKNGCNNFTEKQIKIYNPPETLFNSPLGLVCTNNQFTFVNNTVDNFDGYLSYEWLINDELKSTSRDLAYTFNSQGDQQIKLKSSIPGCSDESTQTITNVQVGPVVDFSYDGKCEGEEIQFTNMSSGLINTFQWDFGNGNLSTMQNPSEIYTEKGNYNVVLQATAANGCIATYVKPLSIYSVPQPNFSIELPPFSCAGSPSQFNDLTPPLTDSNITNRLWSFGDASNGTSTQTNPAYTYNQAGDYQIALGVTSNFGCSNTFQKTITIQPSPTVNFTNIPACLNQPTQFTDASGADVKAWLWSIQNSSYTTKNATHAFSGTGAQTAMLTVTANNNCISQILKTITIPVPVSIDFTSQSTCASKASVFTAANSGGNDPAVSWSWDFAGQPGSGSPAQHVFSSIGSYPVKLSSTRQSGCVYSVTKSINITQPPVANFTMNPEDGGAPLVVSFVNKSTAATNYLWKFNAANTSTEFSPSFVFNQPGTYPVELIASNAIGCSDSFKKDVQVVVPQINAVLSQFRLTSNTDGTLKAVVTLENTGNITITNPEVYLDLSGITEVKERLTGTIPPNQTLTRTLTTSILPVNLSYACAEVSITGDSNAFDNRECTNLESDIIFIQPYPNPANDIIYLDWINQNLESLQVIIYNSSGQAVLNQVYAELLPGLNQVEINVSQLAPGIYLASYSAGGVFQSLRFSVVR